LSYYFGQADLKCVRDSERRLQIRTPADDLHFANVPGVHLRGHRTVDDSLLFPDEPTAEHCLERREFRPSYGRTMAALFSR
jgi:hypothetical protein